MVALLHTPFAQLLIDWYDGHHRSLPWRVSPRARHEGHPVDAYHVWLSEIMLQQTTVRAVRPYFLDFVQRWPTVRDLAAASQDEVLGAWSGLGYYSRARNLKRCADFVAGELGGRFPDDADALAKLPGIGAYTSAAIAAIAFDRPVPVVDGNVERVVTRLFAIGIALPAAKPVVRERVAKLTPRLRPGDFAQAMMDLGATICTPRRPACALCPLNAGCAAFAGGNPEIYPKKAPKKAKPARRGAAFVAVDGHGAVYLTKRPDKGMLAGMAQVPTTDWTSRADGETGRDAAPFVAQWHNAGSVDHVFTHFSLNLDIFTAVLTERPQTGDGWWSPPDRLAREALPTLMKKAIVAALPHAFDP